MVSKIRFLVIAFAMIAVVGAASLPADYLPPVVDNSLPVQEYLAPAKEAAEDQTVVGDDGYRYKAVYRLKLRHRRDVNELPQNEYLPPAEEAKESVAIETAEPSDEVKTDLADDGYRYKVVRRLKYRKRRDVDELPQNEYLPPTEVAQEAEVAEAAESVVTEAAEPAAEEQTELADDGYRYKVVRRLKYRKRRDVDELPQNEYLPPVEEAQETAVAVADEPAAEEQTELADDGYRYKIVRRLKYRKRRDVNELPQNEYLPPTEEAQEVEVTEAAETAVESATEEQTELADDGYRYKVVRRLKYRKRRDVDELPQNEYLPPVEEAQETAVAVADEPAAEEQTELADDGYRYKIVRRLKYRKRRDVNELPQNEYLPPTEEAQEVEVTEAAETAVESATEEQTELADDGYRYKVVRRLKYRKRRDVDELPQNEYLPPVEEAQETAVAVADEPAAEEQTELADDGYRYKVVRRLKYRKRRDVNELPQNEYLPPVEQAQETAIIEAAEPAAEEQTELADDGYRYKVVRRLKYRKRRDVNELPQNEYLPPTEEAQEAEVAEAAEAATESAAEEQTELADDGYRYKVVRRLKYRKRRDVNELPQNEYLPPTEEAQEAEVAEAAETATESAAEEQTKLADDGYRYKVVRRLKYRKRRDVNELPQNEYLPPTEEAQEAEVAEAAEAATESAAEEQTELADDGYRYKVVRRLKYRKRRDVNELPQNEYVPPTEEAQEAEVAEAAETATESAAEEQTELADDGYRYKVVRRLKYRKRRDVNELPQNEYLPPTEEAQEAEVAEAAETATESAAEEQTELADDGYRYKVVRRLKYRKRRDVDELPQNEYLPPNEEAQEAEVAEAAETATESAAEEQTELADDGYRYKVVRRLKYRKRRDVDELPQNEYLPPSEAIQETGIAEVTETVPEDASILASDGYRYKTVRRLKYRQRRDVSELPGNEYLPPTEEGQAVAEQQPEEETAVLADDGYRYKSVYRRH
ncbi:titin-like [Anastrepha obliqua]|uniref:titin-like n=1 Tax=Anastrepha obliqua TaxID=95512 RepID=UPI0024095E35|nr:titin-like [Anastrepha obliqua]